MVIFKEKKGVIYIYMRIFEFTVNDRIYAVQAHSLVTALLQLSDMIKGTIQSITCKVI